MSAEDRQWLIAVVIVAGLLALSVLLQALGQQDLAVFCAVFATTFATLRSVRIWLMRRDRS